MNSLHDWRSLRRLFVAVAFGLAPLIVQGATPAEVPVVPKFAPFLGRVGYEEVPLSADSWYVAFHGTRSHTPAVVQAAWAARAAQLCAGVQRGHYVELRYVGEPVLTDDRITERDARALGRWYAVGGYYIPIFIPSFSGQTMTVITPSKMAAVRCVANVDQLRDKTRAVSNQDALQTAKGMGLDIK